MDENSTICSMSDSLMSQQDQTDYATLHEVQSRAEKIEIRRSYRKLIQETQDNKEELIKPDSNGLMDNIAKAQELFEKVKETREGALDSRFMSLAVSLGAQKTSLLQTDLVAFQPDEFVQKLISVMGGTIGEDINDVNIPDSGWDVLGKKVTPYFTSIVPALHLLSGVIDRVELSPTQNAKRQKLNDDLSEKAQLPQHVTNYRTDAKEATPEEISRVYNKIRRLYRQDPSPIDFFELVVNSASYGHTIENIFHLSFLVKDGLVKVFLSEVGLPVVELVEAVNDHSNGDDAKRSRSAPVDGVENESNNQVIVSLSYDEWEQIVDAYDLKGKPALIEPTMNQ